MNTQSLSISRFSKNNRFPQNIASDFDPNTIRPPFDPQQRVAASKSSQRPLGNRIRFYLARPIGFCLMSNGLSTRCLCLAPDAHGCHFVPATQPLITAGSRMNFFAGTGKAGSPRFRERFGESLVAHFFPTVVCDR